ncbi:DeoR/GlpR transcriptional regulator [Enterococcus saccharolyticus]|uniref:HTH deoR-type domain-containing protein n=1 Tax=Candidatus Enterococcus willemsii TaxID=1857215 RepID=A0ABQ6YWT8_9ENTE|nr:MULTISPECIES: DeoR/GlpR family DNA-binding transcription regulator [Enterococcus]KAF1302161.1 hypothetical protein BAU17_01955 [Enterococcus sp. CU12B]MCD5001858.1 DeoR/GlpR transcriptional regulator [Enterococcus saccharolyticus]
MKKSQGDVFQRREKILALLKHNEKTVQSLAEYFHVSPVTIRRDLLFLEKKGLIERYYGGVRLNQLTTPTHKTASSSVFPIDLFITALIPYLLPDMTIFIGASPSSFRLIQALAGLDITIVTNDYLAGTIENSRATIALTGGQREIGTNALVGNLAIHSCIKFDAQLCLLEASGVNLHEVTTETLNESYVYRTMMEHTNGPKLVYFPANRLETTGNFMINRTFLFDVFYTDTISRELITYYQKHGVQLHTLSDKRS